MHYLKHVILVTVNMTCYSYDFKTIVSFLLDKVQYLLVLVAHRIDERAADGTRDSMTSISSPKNGDKNKLSHRTQCLLK